MTSVQQHDLIYLSHGVPQISNLIDDIDQYKSSQIKDINTRLFKDFLKCTIDQICILFNRILAIGIFPDLWKIACVVPIDKAGCHRTVSNYRPIFLLPLIAKLPKKIIHSRLYHFLNDTNFFSPSQGGFRPNMGTHDTIVSMLSYIYTHFNNSTYISTMLKSHLSNRRQQCKINDIISNTTAINYGVPQGSILGPLLFIIFINDIAEKITNTQVSLYADDTAFYLGGEDPVILSNELTIASNTFDKWCKDNRLTLNQKKCKSMFFSPKRRKKIHLSNFPIFINGLKIDNVQEFKYLGIILDSNLSFESHINMIRKRITSQLFTLKKIRWMLSQKVALAL